MEWFVEAVIGAHIFRNEHNSAPPLTFENVRIDATSTILIDSLSSQFEQLIAGSLSSDISMLCQFFLHIYRSLKQLNRFFFPLHYKQEDMVFARIMTPLVEHFVASGDLILQKSSPQDHSHYFANFFCGLDKKKIAYSNPFLSQNLAALFARYVLHPNNCDSFILPDHSFLRGNNVKSSEKLLDVVKKIKETHSLEGVRNAHYDWKEWVKLMEKVKMGVESLNDISFLQSRCFRAALLSLQTKHQLRAKRHRIKKNSFADTYSFRTTDDPSFFSTTISSFTNLTLNHHSSFHHLPSSADSSSYTSTISTQTSLPTQQSSVSQLLISDQLAFHSDSIVDHSQQMLLKIHRLLTRPPPPSFSWNIRTTRLSESDEDAHFQPHPHIVDRNETFDTSLFDEMDDQKVVASLRRCGEVVKATQSTKCIVDVEDFKALIVSGLHSSSHTVRLECSNLFFQLGDFLQIVDDPRDRECRTLQNAFRDGTIVEQRTLLELWGRWNRFRFKNRNGQMMKKEDFDFDGFLAADLSDNSLFSKACIFIRTLLFNAVVSISFQWRLDFLVQFEKRHQMMSRLSSLSALSRKSQSEFDLTSVASTLGSYLSVIRGFDFPSALTELITIDLASSPHYFSHGLNPAFYLNHTSLAPKHRPSFFPMDLLFERFIRSYPDAFFAGWPLVSDCTRRMFLFTPYVGLHSLLLRCPKLNLNEESVKHLVGMLSVRLSGQDTTQVDIVKLFNYFPPPRLFDTVLSSPSHIRTNFNIWINFLALFIDVGALPTPFGACSSHATMFRILAPVKVNPNKNELYLLRKVGDVVVSLHWLSIPALFDSPLLCRLPSLAGAQRGVLQTLSSHSGIPSLVPHLPSSNWNSIRTMLNKRLSPCEGIRLMCLSVRSIAHSDFQSSVIDPSVLQYLTGKLLSPLPALVSAAFEFFHRFVRVASDAVRIELVMEETEKGNQ
ncbi:hypothetical protein BLNAU_12134 [Blattamonas nauphoetae]|uniref:Uncharacterized protein n=1 Tax=Blattamonas nauphoetae TaxID=2049346 RepID=A0ABQ9XKK2_9EUKA|nr:hypothetical protein BLNAU_12134 [Blattamonas nauphoetae]